jgi:hypothetical protein
VGRKEEANERGRWVPESSLGIYSEGVDGVYGGFHRRRLDNEGGVWGRRREPNPGNGWVASVAQRPGRGGLGFRPSVTETGLPWVGTLGKGARRGWHGVNVTVPCRFGCRARLDGVQALRNARPALDALGGSLTSVGTVGVASHGRARVKPFWGIDPGCRGESGGEVTGRGVDGGLLTKRGCPQWPWRCLGGRGVFAPSHCELGLALGFL